jgi:drug/metabolite transporter (DMT)-like permease
MQERDKQLAHFDALDTKAGVLLAFDGVLIVISPGIQLAFQLPGIIFAALSALLALATFWPRKFPSLDPWVFRQFLTYDTESAGLKVHDTIAE